MSEGTVRLYSDTDAKLEEARQLLTARLGLSQLMSANEAMLFAIDRLWRTERSFQTTAPATKEEV